MRASATRSEPQDLAAIAFSLTIAEPVMSMDFLVGTPFNNILSHLRKILLDAG